MPIRQLPLVTGEIYHIINRGVAQSPIFSTQKDYQRLIETLDYYRFIDVPGKLSRYKSLPIDQRDSIKADLDKNGKKLVEIVAYCLMPNHFYLFLKQLEDGGISQFMRKSSVSYGRYFNTRSDRLGALLQGVFKAIRIVSEDQLLHVIRYIHINPYVGFVVKKTELRRFPWSSLPDYLDERRSNLISQSLIREWFSSAKAHWEFINDEADYQRHVKELAYLHLE